MKNLIVISILIFAQAQNPALASEAANESQHPSIVAHSEDDSIDENDEDVDSPVSSPIESMDDDNFLERIVRDGASRGLRSHIEEEAVNFLDEQLARALERESSNYIAKAQTLYSIYNGSQSYAKAGSEQARYFAASGIVADVLVLSGVGSAIGGTLKLALLGQMLTASYISRDGYKDMLRQYAIAAQIDHQRMSLVLRRARGELKFLRTLWSQTLTAIEAADQLQKLHRSLCSEIEKIATAGRLEKCLGNSRRVLLLRAMAARHLKSLALANLEVLSIKQFETFMKIEPGVFNRLAEEFEKEITGGRKNLILAEASLQRLHLKELDSRFTSANESERRALLCFQQINKRVSPALRARAFFDSSDPTDIAIYSLKIEEARETFQQVCTKPIGETRESQRSALLEKHGVLIQKINARLRHEEERLEKLR